MARDHMPTRRPNITREVEWRGHRFSVTIGFCPTSGQPREVFAGGKTGTDLGALISDACVWGSLLLQHGATPEALQRSLLKVPGMVTQIGAEPRCEPASVLGAIAAVLIDEGAAT